jgi:lipid A disaccharide synthetase
VLGQLDRDDREALTAEFAQIHERLRRGASARAAEAILELLPSARPAP